MKFSQDTIALLKNWATINPGLIFEKGTRQFSNTIAKTLRSTAIIEEDMPQGFAVASLSSFISAAQFFGADTELEFTGTYAEIVSPDGNEKMRYMYSDPRLVEQQNKNLTAELDCLMKCIVTPEMFKQLNKAASVIGGQDILLYNEDEKLYLTVENKTVDSSSNYRTFVGEFSGLSKDYKVYFKKSNLKLMENFSYEVSISEKGLSIWTATDAPYAELKYFVVIEASGSILN